ISCHSLVPIALARPVLNRLADENQPTKLETKVLEQAKRRIANWDRLDNPEFQLSYDFDEDKKKQSRGTEAGLNALVFAMDERSEARVEANDDIKKAMAILWAFQITQVENNGSWDWLNFGLEPWESPNARYVGAAMAAIAVGSKPGNGIAGALGD